MRLVPRRLAAAQSALGDPRSAAWRLAVGLSLVLGVAVWLFLRRTLESAGVPSLALHGGLWSAWLLWLAWIGGGRVTLSPVQFAFRLLPGASLAFALFAAPFASGVVDGSLDVRGWRQVIGAASIAMGAAAFLAGARRLGVTRLAFAQEFTDAPLVLETHGIYGRVRHPCFAGALLASIGAGWMFGALALELAAMNAAAVLVYVRLEDRRLVRAHGETYAEYARQVPALIPDRGGERRAKPDANSCEARPGPLPSGPASPVV